MGRRAGTRKRCRERAWYRVYGDGELESSTQGFAEKLVAHNPLAIRMIKRSVYQSLHLDMRASLDLISSHMGIVQTNARALRSNPAGRTCARTSLPVRAEDEVAPARSKLWSCVGRFEARRAHARVRGSPIAWAALAKDQSRRAALA